jgi:hypothetical protein
VVADTRPAEEDESRDETQGDHEVQGPEPRGYDGGDYPSADADAVDDQQER